MVTEHRKRDANGRFVPRDTVSAAWWRERRSCYERQWKADNAAWVSLLVGLRRYALTLDQYHAKQESQDFLCAICGEERPLQIDHDHATQMVRGLLCGQCNKGLGLFRESPEKLASAQSYLVRNSFGTAGA